MTWLADLFARLLSAFFTFWSGERMREEIDAANKRADAAEAASETKDVISETADARANVPASTTDPDALAGELRAERTEPDGSSPPRRRRPF